MSVCICVCVYLYACKCAMCVWVSLYVCVCMYVCMYVFVQVHTCYGMAVEMRRWLLGAFFFSIMRFGGWTQLMKLMQYFIHWVTHHAGLMFILWNVWFSYDISHTPYMNKVSKGMWAYCLFLNKKDIIICILCIWVFCLHVDLCTTCLPAKAEEGVRFLGTWVKDSC